MFGLGKDSAFQKACTDEYIDLLGAQEVRTKMLAPVVFFKFHSHKCAIMHAKRLSQILRNKYGSDDIAVDGSSITDTILSLIRHAAANKRDANRLLSDVDKLGKKFRIPEKRLWHIKVKAFAENGEWENLRSLGDSKTKSPIGFKPFARAAIKGKLSAAEVKRYIERVTVPEERYDLFCEAEMWKRAIDEASKMRDSQRIVTVRASSNSEEIQELCNKALSRLG